jgi:hypothetical protein
MTYATTNSNIMKKYQQQLPENLRTKYQSIVAERTRIYYFGYLLGFILAILIIFYNKTIKRAGFSNLSLICLVTSVSFLTNYFYYILSPKTDWMLNHIQDGEQSKAWLKMYRGMQVYYHGGLVLGIAAVGLLAFAFRC